MKLFGLFGKPDWQSKNAETRAKAVAASQDQALVDSIPDIACHDQNPAVRKQAIKRLTNLAMLADRSRNDEDADNRRLAKDRFVDLLLEDLPGVVTSLHDRERLIRVEDDQSVLMEVAKKSKYPELRRLSLERISKPGFIVERCLLDASPDIRMWLLGRIDTVGVLEKIAEQARKKTSSWRARRAIASKKSGLLRATRKRIANARWIFARRSMYCARPVRWISTGSSRI